MAGFGTLRLLHNLAPTAQANTRIHLTASPRCARLAAGDARAVSQRVQAIAVAGKGARMKMCKPFASCVWRWKEIQWFPKSRNPFKPCEIQASASLKVRAKKWQLRAMARQGGSLHHEKPPGRCDTRRNSYETGARGLQRDIVQAK